MARYLLIESRDPFQSNDVRRYYEIAHGLRSEGHEVMLFLVDNGVLPARRSSESSKLSELARAGVQVLADEFALRERGISRDVLAEGIRAAPIEVVIDALEEGRKAMWH